MTFQPRSATLERGCMTLQTKSMEIQPLLGHQKTLMNDFSTTGAIQIFSMAPVVV